jgi:hypothetical protein
VVLGEPEREPLLAYLESRLHLASGELPELRCARAAEVEINAPKGVCWHLDDKNWPSAEPMTKESQLTVSCLAGAVTFVAAPAAFRRPA